MGRGIVAAILELDTKFHPLIMLCQDPSFVNIAVPNASYHHRQPNLKMLTIFSIFFCGYVSILSSELLIRDQYAVFMEVPQWGYKRLPSASSSSICSSTHCKTRRPPFDITAEVFIVVMPSYVLPITFTTVSNPFKIHDRHSYTTSEPVRSHIISPHKGIQQ
ncbi:hypothetical protein FOXYSP1_09493 [Fusarium oxysporum f. sp. phaseoli]